MSNPVLDQLRSQIQTLERGAFERELRSLSSTDSDLNAWLPQAGFSLGSFVELLQENSGFGAYSLALKLSRHAADLKPVWAVLDTEATFNPRAAEAFGWELKNLVLVRSSLPDGGWAFAQFLRSKDIGACFWASSSMDNMVFRRLQLAAERGGGLGFVIRPMAALRKPCWGSLRIQVSAGGANRVRLKLLHARGQPDVSQKEIEVTL